MAIEARRGERGSASALVISSAGLLGVLGWAMATVVIGVVAEVKLSAATELAAVVAADARRGLRTEVPCSVAAAVIEENVPGAESTCAALPDVPGGVRIEARSQVFGVPISVSSQAGGPLDD